jgi:hypothetical protein
MHNVGMAWAQDTCSFTNAFSARLIVDLIKNYDAQIQWDLIRKLQDVHYV